MTPSECWARSPNFQYLDMSRQIIFRIFFLIAYHTSRPPLPPFKSYKRRPPLESRKFWSRLMGGYFHMKKFWQPSDSNGSEFFYLFKFQNWNKFQKNSWFSSGSRNPEPKITWPGTWQQVNGLSTTRADFFSDG